MYQRVTANIDRLVAALRLSNTIPELKRRIVLYMLLLGMALLGYDLLFALWLDFDWITSLLNGAMFFALAAAGWLLWRRRQHQELILLVLFLASALYLGILMYCHTARLPAEIVQASILRTMAPWFLWFMLLNMASFAIFRAEIALCISLILSAVAMLVVTWIILSRMSQPIQALHDFALLLLSNMFVILLAYPTAQHQERTLDIDFLTLLPNRTRGYNMLLHEIERAGRYNTIFTILLLDLDNFKKVNDSYGHPTGDIVLREFAAFVNHHIRKTDMLCRWGGEEFLLVMPHNDLKSGRLKADHLRLQIKNRAFAQHIRVTSSFGVTAYYPHDTPNTLLERADAALYRAKANGRNCVETE